MQTAEAGLAAAPGSQNRAGHRDFRAHLRGLVAWAGHGDERRAARSEATFAEIVWTA